MLKIAVEAEEKSGGLLMAWWEGQGAARVLAQDDEAGVLLLERAPGTRSLKAMARNGDDDEACRILCQAVQRLHAPRDRPLPPSLTPLPRWFRELEPTAAKHGGILARSADMARRLLSEPQDIVALHGDIHHDNILDFGPERGWLAIDPKGLYGERGFDYANLFCNPDDETAASPGRLSRRADVITEASGLDRTRLLQWVLAWAGLSTAWMLNDGMNADNTLEIAALAAAELKSLRGT